MAQILFFANITILHHVPIKLQAIYKLEMTGYNLNIQMPFISWKYLH